MPYNQLIQQEGILRNQHALNYNTMQKTQNDLYSLLQQHPSLHLSF